MQLLTLCFLLGLCRTTRTRTVGGPTLLKQAELKAVKPEQMELVLEYTYTRISQQYNSIGLVFLASGQGQQPQ